jgi:hypothetical protein
MLAVDIVNPDVFAAPWSRSARLQQIGLVYRLIGTREWQTAVNANSKAVSFSFTVQPVSRLSTVLNSLIASGTV